MNSNLKLAFAVQIGLISITAQAQSSVTLYGVVDAGLLYQSTAAASLSPTAKNLGSVWRYQDGGIYQTNWGIRAVEDIGGGYYVTVNLQSQFNSGNGKMGLSDTAGTSALFGQSTVGISGPFGSIKAGRQIAPMAYALQDTDVRAADYFGSILTALVGINQAAGWTGTSTNGSLGAIYDSSAIVYSSPSFSGTTVTFEYEPGGVAGSIQGNTRESAVLRYSNYGLHLDAVYYNAHDTSPGPATVATGLDNNRFIYFGALYNIHNLSMSLSYSNGRNPSNSAQANLDMYSAGLGYSISPTLTVNTGVYYLRDRNNSTNKSIEVASGAYYSLTKSSLLYAQFAWVNNRGTMGQPIAYGQPVAPGMSTTAVMLGMRHSF